MEYSCKDARKTKQSWETISDDLVPIVVTILSGKLYVSQSYVYYTKPEFADRVAVVADHIDLYRSEHPEFTE